MKLMHFSPIAKSVLFHVVLRASKADFNAMVSYVGVSNGSGG
tara:strand:+ start:165 stop:290 length:126 start_codon:yes stop_codon:yes gene_type:complete